MLKAIRLQLSQQLANYRKPASFLIKESYPLPPYSSVIGMIHAACDFKEYHQMKLSIQGSYASEVSDLAVLYNFGIKYDANRHQYKVKNIKEEYDGINRGVRNIHLLTDIELLIYIVPEREEDYESIRHGLLYPKNFISLGRYEDIVRIEEVEEVILEKYDSGSEAIFIYPAYLPINQKIDNIRGTVYKLKKRYHIDKKTKMRVWDEVITVQYIAKDSKMDLKNSWQDNEKKAIVCLA